MGYFGTDGVRGVANSELTCEIAFSLGKAAAKTLGGRFVIGRDTRRSGPMLEAALVAGITSMGGDALLAGIVPTPAVAMLVRELGAQGGVVISASHNTPEYNGIKFFDSCGYKLSKETEQALEECMLGHLAALGRADGAATPKLPVGDGIGCVQALADAATRYAEFAADAVRSQGVTLDGMKVALDCAHGAAAATSEAALRMLGAEVVAANTDYSGDDINENCGSTHLECIRALVAKTGADAGIAHDGDADRTLAVSASGAVVDGDRILAICARDLKDRGLLHGNTVVGTVMSNLGLGKAMQAMGVELIQTDVGDSNVLAAMRAGGFVLGGEQSGHIIFSEHNSTGDGLVTALMLLAAMRRSGSTLDDLAKAMTSYPQVMVNVRDVDKGMLGASQKVWAVVAEAEAALEASGGGRVLVRPSGTEPLVRVMVEAATQAEAEQAAGRIAAVVAEELG